MRIPGKNKFFFFQAEAFGGTCPYAAADAYAYLRSLHTLDENAQRFGAPEWRGGDRFGYGPRTYIQRWHEGRLASRRKVRGVTIESG